MALRKVSNALPVVREPSDSQTAKRWPELWQYLTQRMYDDDKNQPRETSTITFYCRDDGTVGVTLNDRDNSRACFAAGDTLMGALDTLNALVASPKTVWREDRLQTGASRRKK